MTQLPMGEELAQDLKKAAAEAIRHLQETNDIWEEIREYIATAVGDHRWKVIIGRAAKEDCWALVLILPDPRQPAQWLFIEKQENGFKSTYL